MTTSAQIQVTDVQASEVRGLLDVCADEHMNGSRDDEGWGRLDGRTLTVFDAAEAIDDLRWRADWNEAEADVSDEARKGAAAARSLRSLADKIGAL